MQHIHKTIKSICDPKSLLCRASVFNVYLYIQNLQQFIILCHFKFSIHPSLSLQFTFYNACAVISRSHNARLLSIISFLKKKLHMTRFSKTAVMGLRPSILRSYGPTQYMQCKQNGKNSHMPICVCKTNTMRAGIKHSEVLVLYMMYCT
jgi:hypothetical protein